MNWLLFAGLILGGVLAGWTLKWVRAKIKLISSRAIARREAEEIRHQTSLEQKEMINTTRAELDNDRELTKTDWEERRSEVDKFQEKVGQLEQSLLDREKSFKKLQDAVQFREQAVQQYRQRNQEDQETFRHKLETRSGFTREALITEQVRAMELDEMKDAQHVLNRLDEETRRVAENKTREMLVTSVQRLPISQVIQNGPTNLDPPNQEMLGRLMAREGRFIRMLENILDVEICIEDSTEALLISSPDPVKREIAKATVDRLFKNGRINPGRLKETIRNVARSIEKAMFQEADRVCRDLRLHNFRKEAKAALGRLLYRYSYGQNQLYHAKEAAMLAAMIAHELGCDTEIAKRGALLHDIGKGFAHDDKTHVELGVEMAEEWHEHPMVVNAIAAHHGDSEQLSSEAAIVQIAESMSGARPGARRETMVSYLERVEKLENIAYEFDGVDTAFAIYAGRELRIIVNSDKVGDKKAQALASEIAAKVEENLNFPGRIKITVIREMKTASYTN